MRRTQPHTEPTANTYHPARWRRCRDCEGAVRRGEPHVCLKRGVFAARAAGTLGALAFAAGAAMLAAEMLSR